MGDQKPILEDPKIAWGIVFFIAIMWLGSRLNIIDKIKHAYKDDVDESSGYKLDSINSENLFDLGIQAFSQKRYDDAKALFYRIQVTSVSKKAIVYLSKIDSIDKKDGKQIGLDTPKPYSKSKLKSLKKELKGKVYTYPWSLTVVEKYGQPVTLKGTNNFVWYAYFPKGDFTIQLNKDTDTITDIYPTKAFPDADGR